MAPDSSARHGIAPIRDLVEYPAGTMNQSSEDQADAQRGRDRPPASIAKDPGHPSRMTGGKYALQKLLRGVDHDQACRTDEPQADQRERVARYRSLTGQRRPQRPEEAADREP